ncbi:MAG TPA: hypothetical protein VKT77_07305, partial [Chthonomonadaceae bacterium]|nr:hypothetical protein [Chthonomonadaceae bacterium]
MPIPQLKMNRLRGPVYSALFVAALVLAGVPRAAGIDAGGRPESRAESARRPKATPADTTVVLDHKRYDLARRTELDAFLQHVRDLRALSKEERADEGVSKKAKKREKKDKAVADTEETPAPAEAGSRHASTRPDGTAASRGAQAHGSREPGQDSEGAAQLTETDEMPAGGKHGGARGRDWTGKKVRAGLKAIEKIAAKIETGRSEPDARIGQVQEIAWAVEANFVTPWFWRPRVDLADFIFDARDTTLNACGRGSARVPATNLRTYGAPDLSRVDPLPSTYWSPPGRIAAEDLYVGCGRTELPDIGSGVCEYSGPHSGYGSHPSFEVTWKGERWKVKFGEECHSGPFAARVFTALGYPTGPADYVSHIKVHYDRRILSKFNARQVNVMHVSVLGMPVLKVAPNRYFDPFESIEYAVLKDGTRVDREALRDGVFPRRQGKSRPKRPETTPANYDRAYEAKIDYVVMRDASVNSKEKDDDTKDIGFWDYNRPETAGLREV